MDSEGQMPRSRLLFDLLWRVLLLALLAVVALHLIITTQLYATAAVALLGATLLLVGMIGVVSRAERSAEVFLEALSAGAPESPARAAVSPALRRAYASALERLQQDRRQRQQERVYLQTLLDTVPAALLVLKADDSLEIVNRAAYRLLGAEGRHLDQLPSLGRAAVQLVALPPGTHRIVNLANGRPMLASSAAFATPEGTSRRLISLQRLAGDLDAVELKAWDDMARVLAHEMMNSLTPIASLSDSLDGLLRSGGRGEEVSAALETITRRSQGLMRFVERYRRVADLPEPQLQPLRLRDLLDGIERLVRPALLERKIALQIHISPNELQVQADRDLLEQALINLLRNAADAAAGEPQPCISLTCHAEGNQCIIDTRDNGPGLSAAQRNQIFVPFFTTKPGGSGIGLSLARRVVLAHGGRIEALSNEPRGSVFRICLPAG